MGNSDSIRRTDRLLSRKFRQLATPSLCAALADAIIICVDSCVAGHFISMSALAAIAIAAPIFAIDEALHCLVGMGVTTQVAQAVGAGDRGKANRITGAAIIVAFVAYVVVLLPLIVFSEAFFGLISSDPELIANAVKYAIPSMIAMPFFEVLLVLEKAYLVDGRPILFASRNVIAGCLNIVLDLFFIVFLQTDISGLAFASVISLCAGYAATMSHGFTRKCTVHPDFSVMGKPAEWLAYTKENLVRGGTAAIDEGSAGLINALVCGLLSGYGVGAVAIWGLFSKLSDFVCRIRLGVVTPLNVLGGMLFGEEDHEGTRIVFKAGMRLGTIVTIAFTVLVFVFIEPIAVFFGIDAEYVIECTKVIRITSPVFTVFFLVDYLEGYLTVINRFRLSYVVNIAEKALIIALVLAFSRLGLIGVIAGYSLAFLLILLYLWWRMLGEGNHLLPSADFDTLAEYSLTLDEQSIASLGRDMQRRATEGGYSRRFATKLALLAEDGLNTVRLKNANAPVHADMRACAREDVMVVSFTDDGAPCNLSASAELRQDLENLEGFMIEKLADEVEYDRVAETNHLVMRLHVSQHDRVGDAGLLADQA